MGASKSRGQVVKLRKTDLDRASVRVSGRSAWEIKQAGKVREQVHADPRSKPPRHKERWEELVDDKG